MSRNVSSQGSAYYQLSYRIIESGEPTRLSIVELEEAIRAANERVRDVVWTGWSMFNQFSRREIAPRIIIETISGQEVEAYETNLRENPEASRDEVWRITADGRATLFRPYREDTMRDPVLARRGLTPGTWFAPRTLVREVYELATHAKEMSKAFPSAARVEFRCTWLGLKGRIIADFEPGTNWHERRCHADQRTSAAIVSVDELTADTAAVVAKLVKPVLNLFDGLDLSREWIARQVPKFRML